MPLLAQYARISSLKSLVNNISLVKHFRMLKPAIQKYPSAHLYVGGSLIQILWLLAANIW